jgi:hypothetical protein
MRLVAEIGEREIGRSVNFLKKSIDKIIKEKFELTHCPK